MLKYHWSCESADNNESIKTSEILEIIFFNYENLINDVGLQRLGKILKANKFIKVKKAGRQRYYLKRQGQNTQDYPAQTLMDIDV